MLKWLLGNNKDDAQQVPPAAIPTPPITSVTPPVVPTMPTPGANTQPRVMFVQAAAVAAPTPSTNPSPAPATTPAAAATPLVNPVSPTPPAYTAPIPQMTPAPEAKVATPPEEKPVVPMTKSDDAPKAPEKSGTIEVSSPMVTASLDTDKQESTADLFAEALEATSTPVEEKKEEKAVEITLDVTAPTEEKKEEPKEEKPTEMSGKPFEITASPATHDLGAMSGFGTPNLSPLSTHTSPSTTPDPDLPDVSSEIKRILQERWITLANQEMEKLNKRRDQITSQLTELEVQQRELTSKKQTLENEKVEVLHSSEGWNAKLKDAQTMVDRIIQEVGSI